ncbi:hypothetical protein [Pedobacter cryophilus]|uniref:Uncharacterized protein n=1 Tax=Pedobacter cryophilus TaxID=2571271 RepID=A0A4U1C5C0_9SPHI|nr:hypothetical protein [Pedobacter cryophilus]TKC00542.1 hypothetical protein FA046_02350 [Pedobacter cryophilus]
MKQLAKFITFLSVLLNFYYNGSWIYSFNKFNLQLERTSYFSENFFFALSVLHINISLIVLTVSSLIILFALNYKYMMLKTVLIVVQFMFLVNYLWQLI